MWHRLLTCATPLLILNEALIVNQQKNDPDHLATFTEPGAALDYLGGKFFGPQLIAEARVVSPAEVPEPFKSLLVHNNHMTTSLEAFHGAPVRLEVIEQRLDGEIYQRKILLTIAPNRVVEVGVVRILLQLVPPAAREEILKQERPLGDILIRHDVLRSIEPRWFFRFDGPPALLSAFDRPLEGPVYGRVGIIHCNGEPAIELLEVISGKTEPRP